METKFIVIMVTAKDNTEAQKIAREILGKRRAACVNIIPAVNSTFWWLDKIESENECLLIIKTSVFMLNAVTEIIKKNHSYSVPEIIALPVVGGNPDYLKWIENTLK
ncbi:MAG: divalent-cation tolerance protein CutA [Dehalococcoidales bacterium]|nr:divalent-cation tolerance protein CutA [Dehalococcoidales bacterium]